MSMIIIIVIRRSTLCCTGNPATASGHRIRPPHQATASDAACCLPPMPLSAALSAALPAALPCAARRAAPALPCLIRALPVQPCRAHIGQGTCQPASGAKDIAPPLNDSAPPADNRASARASAKATPRQLSVAAAR